MNIAQSLDNLKLERDAVLLYDALAAIERDPRRAAAFRQIAANERRHAEIWATQLREPGRWCPPADPAAGPGARSSSWPRGFRDASRVGPRHRARGRRGGDLRGRRRRRPRSRRSPPTSASTPRSGRLDDEPATNAARRGRAAATASGRGRGRGGRAAQPRAPRRSRPRALAPSGRSGTLRAVIFGVSDGLVCNLALVMGVAGASGTTGTSSSSPAIAGLLAGAFSMAAGEYISMQSQRELFERQIALERAELEAMPEEEEAEMAALYRAKGFPRAGGRARRRTPLREPRARPRHAGPRGAGPRSRRARLARRARRSGRSCVRGRGGGAGRCRTCSAAAPGRSSSSLVLSLGSRCSPSARASAS